MNIPEQSLESAIFSERFVSRFSRIIFVTTSLFIAAHLIFVVLFPNFIRAFYHHFNMGEAGYIFQWYRDFVIYGLTSAAAFLIAWMLFSASDKHKRRLAQPWSLIGCIFAYNSMYNNSNMHRVLIGWLDGLVVKQGSANAASATPSIFTTLVLGLPGILAVVFMIVFFQKNLWQNPRARLLVVLAAVLYFTSMIARLGPALAANHGTKYWLVVEASTGLLSGGLWMLGFLIYGVQLIKEVDET